MLGLFFGLALGALLLFQFVVEIRAKFGVLCLDVDGDAEDGAGVDKALGEDAEDRLMDLTGGRYDEPCDSEGEASDEHGYGGEVLNGLFGGIFHIG